MWYLMKFPVIFMLQLLYLSSSCDGRQASIAWSQSRPLRFPAIVLQSIITQKDREFMRRALQLAGKAKRKTFPNPCVGCVIVSENGTIIGEGWHERAGESHAEVKAVQDMRQRGRSTAENATAYVTLEPCNHYGRTPPCTLALISERVRRVVVGMVDPDDRVAGNGLKRLQSNGIEVEVIGGEEEQSARDLNVPYIHRVIHNQSFSAVLLLSSSNASDHFHPDVREKILQEIDRFDSIVLHEGALISPMDDVHKGFLLELLSLYSNVFIVHRYEKNSTDGSLIEVVRQLLNITEEQSTETCSPLNVGEVELIEVKAIRSQNQKRRLFPSLQTDALIKTYLREVYGSNGILFVKTGQQATDVHEDAQLVLEVIHEKQDIPSLKITRHH